MRSFNGRDIVSLKDIERAEYMRIFEIADELAPIARNRNNDDLLSEKTLVTAFYQPSTRTRLATEAAMHRLGGRVVGFSDAKMTRAGDFYQESIKDTIKMLEYYGDVIAMRHFQQGAPHEAAKWASVPIINCGDGWGEHPTQVLTDLYTILKEKGTLDGLNFLCVGDGRMRTMHSMAHAITQFDIEANFVCPPDMGMTEEYVTFMESRNARWRRRAPFARERPVAYETGHAKSALYPLRAAAHQGARRAPSRRDRSRRASRDRSPWPSTSPRGRDP